MAKKSKQIIVSSEISDLTFKTAAGVIAALEAHSSLLQKKEILQLAWDRQILEFFEGAVYAYNPLRKFGIKKAPLIDDSDDPSFVASLTWAKFKPVLDRLESRQLSGNAARDALLAAANTASTADWNGFFRRVVLKDFKCKATDTIINEVLELNGDLAEPYLIPEFSVQLAKNGEDHPKKMVGEKLIDIKLDGVRIISVLDKKANEVTHYTREGRVNTNFPHIAEMQMKMLPHLTTSMVLDGEMVSRNFQALMKQLNRKTKADTNDAKLALFDCLPLDDFLADNCQLTQVQRHEALVEFSNLLQQVSGDTIYVVPKLSVNLDTAEGKKTLAEFNREALEAEYEGVMIKDPNALYERKRTFAWLKIKPYITVDLEVIGFEPGKPESKFANTLGGILGRGMDQGRLIEATVGGGFSEELRDEIWKNRDKVLGRIMEIKTDKVTKSQKDDEIYSLRFVTFERFRGWEPGEKL